MDFITYLKRKLSIDSNTEFELMRILNKKIYRRGDIVRKIDSSNENIYFVETGYARVYYVKGNKDITFYFLGENSFSLPVDTVFFDTISRYGIQAETEIVVVSFNLKEFLKIFEDNSKIDKLLQHEMVCFIKLISDKLFSIQLQTAQERYDTMINTYPEIMQNVSLGHIASYLGITQETLSRVRGGY